MTWAHVQSKEIDTESGGATSSTLTFSSAVGSGNLVVGMFFTLLSGTLTSVTDNKGNSYTVVDSLNAGGGFSSGSIGYTFVGGNLTGGPTVLTFTISGGSGVYYAFADEFSNSGGATPSSPVDVHAVSNPAYTSPTTVTSSSITTTISGDLIWSLAYVSTVTSTLTAGTGYTQTFAGDGANALVYLCAEYQTQASSGAITSTFGVGGTTSSSAGIFIMALKAPSANVLYAQICL